MTMSKKRQWLIYTFGVTHSGKTTFAKQLKDILGSTFELIDPDLFNSLIKENYPTIYQVDSAQKNFDTRALLKYEIFKIIVRHAFCIGLNVIAVSSNINRNVRSRLYEFENVRRIAIVFDITQETILDRINKGRDGLDTYTYETSDHKKLYEKQIERMELPEEDEYEYKFVVDKNNTPEKVQQEIRQLVIEKSKGADIKEK